MTPEYEYMFNQIKTFNMTNNLMQNSSMYKSWPKTLQQYWHEYSKQMIDLEISLDPECYYKAMKAKENFRKALYDYVV